MTAALVLTRARSRIAAAWPAATDRTGNPHPPDEADLPAFAFSLDLDDAEPLGMGSAEFEQSGTLTLDLWVRTTAGADIRADLRTAGDQAVTVILGDPACLDGAAWLLSPAGQSVDTSAGESRLARLAVAFSVTLHGPNAAAFAPSGLGLT